MRLLIYPTIDNIINYDNKISMSHNSTDILLHPIRLRVVLAISGNDLTTTELGERLPDVPPATLYRHVAKLADAGLLEVVRERRSRGGVERTYRLVVSAANIGAEEAVSMTSEEHMTGFVTFVSALVGDFGCYLDHPDSNPGEDAMGYRQAALWLTEGERTELLVKLRGALTPYLALERTEERSRSLLSTILIPDLSAATTKPM